MDSAFQTLTQHLDTHGFHYQIDAEHDYIRTILGGRHAAYQMLLATDKHLWQVFANPGFRVPKGARPQLADALCRANFGLKIGKFEMDMEDGEVRFQASTVLADGQLTEEMIMLVMVATISMLDRYVPAFLSCIYGNEPPEDAMRQADDFGPEDRTKAS